MLTGKNINRALCVAFGTITSALVVAVRLPVDLSSFLPIVFPTSIMVVLVAYAGLRRMPVLSAISETMVVLLVTLTLGLILSYVAATSGAPMLDTGLYSIDRVLGFDWWRYMVFFDKHPVIALTMHVVYLTMLPQLLLTGIVLSATTTGEINERFVTALILALALTNAISALTPAVGIYAFLHVDLSRFAGLSPTTTFQAVAPLNQLRAGTFSALRLDQGIGIISFPSFHCAAATILIWAAMHFKHWGWPLTGLNIAMIVSTPVEGAHYLIDGIAGVSIAVISLLIANWLHRKPLFGGTLESPRLFQSDWLMNSNKYATDQSTAAVYQVS